jgi:hypothetical protein
MRTDGLAVKVVDIGAAAGGGAAGKPARAASEPGTAPAARGAPAV